MRVTAAKRFFYTKHGTSERLGPVTAADLRELWSSGGVNGQTLVFAANGTMRGWLAIAHCDALHAFVRRPDAPGAPFRAEGIPCCVAELGSGWAPTF